MTEVQIDQGVAIRELMLEIEFQRNRKLILGTNAEMLRRDVAALKKQLADSTNQQVEASA